MPRKRKAVNKIPETNFLNELGQLLNVKKVSDSNDIIGMFNNSNEYIPNNSKVHFRYYVGYLLKNIDKSLLKDAFEMINKIYANLYSNTKTLDSFFSKDVRKPILEKYGANSEEYKMSKNLVKISFSEKGKLISEAKKKVFDKNANRLEFTSDVVINIIKDNINSLDPFRRAVALLISCGSRPIEFFQRANFKPDPANGPNWVIQDYIAKSKEPNKKVHKPIIYFKAEEFIDHLKNLRDDLIKKYKTLVDKKGELKNAITGATNITTKEIFNYQDGVSQYIARKLYGAISYELYSKTTNLFGSNPSNNIWLNSVLGHGEKSFMTSHNYSHVALKSQEISNEDIVIKQDILETKIEAIEERLDDLPKAVTLPEQLNDEIYKNKEPIFKLIQKVFDKYVSDHSKNPSQNILYDLSRKFAKRADVRLFMQVQGNHLDNP